MIATPTAKIDPAYVTYRPVALLRRILIWHPAAKRARRHGHDPTNQLPGKGRQIDVCRRTRKRLVIRKILAAPEYDVFRSMVRDLITREVAPNYSEWIQQGHPPREFYLRLGELGILGVHVPEQYGGGGQTSFRFATIVSEECARAAVSFGSYAVHSNLILPYIMRYATTEQKERWLPEFVTGETMFAIAMTEPGTGSDLASISTSARLSDDGSHYILNGAKTFITGGVLADRVLVVCRTARRNDDDRRGGLTILVVDANAPGFAVGRHLDKIGLHASDTAELSFTEVVVPLHDRLGEEGAAFSYLTSNLAQERLAIAVGANASASAAIEFAGSYVRQRSVFGQPLSSFQNTKFVLAECSAYAVAMGTTIDRALDLHDAGALTGSDAARVKLFCTETAGRVIDKCLQLHGGYGYVLEYPIARLYADARVARIYGGTSEVMKTIIAKDLGL
jgi:acyl-CoA dehydrogenase